jgi:2-keto-3-deoxy-L-fuconate dehydrogenase
LGACSLAAGIMSEVIAVPEAIAVKLANKRVLVTAAGQGIGRAIAAACKCEGAEVFATDLLVEKLDGLKADGLYAMDVCDAAAIDDVLKTVGTLDVLVNCAGQVDGGNILQTTDAQWMRALDINVMSMVRTIRSTLPRMLAHGGGSIINIASVVSSIKAAPNRCAYAASKAAVIGLTKSVAIDFIEQGIRCSAICPGTIDTPSLAERISAQSDPEEARRTFVSRQPMKRLGTPEEIAALAVYLASDDAAFNTGSVHIIDGGYSL